MAVDQLRMILAVIAVIHETSGTQYIIHYIFTRATSMKYSGGGGGRGGGGGLAEKKHLGARATNTRSSTIDDHYRADLTRTVNGMACCACRRLLVILC